MVDGRRADDDRLLAALDRPGVRIVDHFGQHHRDVVGCAAGQSQFDELLPRRVEILPAEGLLDRLVGDHAEQPVRTQQPAVAGHRLAHGLVEFDVARGVAQGPHDDVPLGVVFGLLGRELAVVDEELDEGVVVGHLRELAVAQEVGPRIADVNHGELVRRAEQGDARRAHPGQIRVVLSPFDEVDVRLVDRLAQDGEQIVGAVHVVVEGRQVPDRHRGGDVSCSGSAHSIGEHEEVGGGVAAVLIVRADEADVRIRRETKLDSHQRSSIVVLPMTTGIPGAICRGVLMRCPPTYVPFVESRSSTHQAPSDW